MHGFAQAWGAAWPKTLLGNPVRVPDGMESRGESKRIVLVGATLMALAVSAVPLLQRSAASSRDLARLDSLFEINRALHAWQLEFGEPPAHVPDPYAGGWETSRDGNFLEVLVRNDYLRSTRLDPVNDKELQFRYHRYERGAYGNSEPFYILALTGLESDSTRNGLPAASTELRVGGRNWGDEFPIVLGGP